MPTDSNPERSLGAVMSAEAGYEVEVDDSPLRISGFIAAILGVISVFTIVALPVVGVAIAAVLFGMFALRKSDSKSIPVGTTAARIGILLALLFGSWGVARTVFKTQTLGTQAEYFAREFVRVTSSGNDVYSKELMKSYVNRYLKNMPLEERYAMEKKRAAEMAAEHGEEQGSDFSTEEDNGAEFLLKYPEDHEWILDRPVRVFTRYGRQKADVVLAYDESETPTRVRILMEYLKHKEDGTSQWHVELCMPYRERIVAESIL